MGFATVKSSGGTSPAGAFFVAIAAILWATDSLFRYPLMSRGLNPILIVLIDHLICSAVLLPFVYFRNRGEIFSLAPRHWIGVIFIGAGASGLATVLFTASFGLGNPSVSILLQKLQPIVVIALAFLFLRERPTKNYWIWGSIALLSGVVLSFPSFDFAFTREISLEAKGSVYALIAAGIWAVGTIVGKSLLQTVKPGVVTFWRFAFGVAFLLVLALLSGISWENTSVLIEPENLKSIGYISLVSGLGAMSLYYMGLSRTTATITTLLELLFPVTAVILNYAFLGVPLKPAQILAALALLFAVTQLHPTQNKA